MVSWCRGLKRQLPTLSMLPRFAMNSAVDYITQKALNYYVYIYDNIYIYMICMYLYIYINTHYASYISYYFEPLAMMFKNIHPPKQKAHSLFFCHKNTFSKPTTSPTVGNSLSKVQRCYWQRLETSWCDSNARASSEYGHGGGWTHASWPPTYDGAGLPWRDG